MQVKKLRAEAETLRAEWFDRRKIAEERVQGSKRGREGAEVAYDFGAFKVEDREIKRQRS